MLFPGCSPSQTVTVDVEVSVNTGPDQSSPNRDTDTDTDNTESGTGNRDTGIGNTDTGTGPTDSGQEAVRFHVYCTFPNVQSWIPTVTDVRCGEKQRKARRKQTELRLQHVRPHVTQSLGGASVSECRVSKSLQVIFTLKFQCENQSGYKHFDTSTFTLGWKMPGNASLWVRIPPSSVMAVQTVASHFHPKCATFMLV